LGSLAAEEEHVLFSKGTPGSVLDDGAYFLKEILTFSKERSPASMALKGYRATTTRLLDDDLS
jgi:hypothetical protein